MKYRVQLKSTVTWWVTVDECEGLAEHDRRECVADTAVDGADFEQRAEAVRSGECEWGPIGLAYENLDESVRGIS